MNKFIKRTAISLSALGALSVVRGAADTPSTELPQQTASTNHHNTAAGISEQLVRETVEIITGHVDTVSAGSTSQGENSGNYNGEQTTCASGLVWDAANGVCRTNTLGGNTSGTGQSANSVSGLIDLSNNSPVPNPLAIPDACVTIGLPFLSGGSNCVDNDPSKGGAILIYARDAIKLLSMSIGGIIVLMIVISGVQYIISVGNATQVASAKKHLFNAITALVLFGMAYAIINFLLPGGLQ